MVLEATVIVIDNSEYMRNGDYTPTRFGAQIDAVSLVFTAKTQSNPENTVGLMTLGGNGPEVKVTLTSDFGKILAGIHDTKINGGTHLATAINVAALVLKHRQNRVQRQRIIVFVASPITDQSSDLVKLAKKMKKNNVAVDFVSFGQEGDNTDKLERFIDQVNSGDNSHLVTVPPGPHLLSDVLTSSPIINEGGAGGFGGGVGGSGAAGGSNEIFEFGVDPSVDPELALALRMSLEDEKARQAQEAAAAKAAAESAAPASTANEEKNGSSAKDDTQENPNTDK